MASTDHEPTPAPFADRLITGSLKLTGPAQSVDQSKTNAAIDAAYLLDLVNHLTASLRKPAGPARESLAVLTQEVTPSRNLAPAATGQRPLR